MAMIVDEHGGVVGLATSEDLIEEVVGEIRDERDLEENELSVEDGNTFECDGGMEVDELADHLGSPIEKDGFETVAGLVLKIAGRIPSPGEQVVFDEYDIEVLSADTRRLDRLRFTRRDTTGSP